MDIRSLISKLESIESKIVNEQALTLQQVATVEKTAADKAAADKAKGGWTGFTTWDPKTAGDIALSKLADQHGLPGLFNSKGEYVVAAGKRMDGETGEKPQIAPPTPSDWEPLQKLGLVPRNAEGPAGLTDLLTGGKAGQEFNKVKGDSAKVSARNSSDAFIKERLAKLRDLIAKLKATMGDSASNFSLRDIRRESIARELIESFGYTLEGFNDSAEDLIRKRAMAQTAKAPGTPLTNFGTVGDKIAQQRAANVAPAAPAAPTTAPTAVDNVAKAAGVSNAEKVAGTAAAKAGKTLGKKIAARVIPGVGMAADAADAYSRWKEGDKVGAAIAGLGAGLGWVPGVSWAALAANQARDYKAGRGELFGPNGAIPSGAQPTKESVVGSITSFRNRLELIEAKSKIEKTLDDEYLLDWDGNLYNIEGVEITDELTKQVIWESVWDKEVILDEGFWDKLAAKGVGAARGVRDFFKGVASPRSPAAYRDALKSGSGPTLAGAKIARVAQKNPVKTAVAGAGLGTAAGLGLSGGSETPAAEPAAPGSTGGQSAQPATTTTEPAKTEPAKTEPAKTEPAKTEPASSPAAPTSEQAELIKQIKVLMGELHDIEEEPVIATLQDAQDTIDAIENTKPKGTGLVLAADEFAPTATQYGAFGEPPTGK